MSQLEKLYALLEEAFENAEGEDQDDILEVVSDLLIEIGFEFDAVLFSHYASIPYTFGNKKSRYNPSHLKSLVDQMDKMYKDNLYQRSVFYDRWMYGDMTFSKKQFPLSSMDDA